MHIANTPVLPLLYTVFQSIFQVFLLCLTGYYLSWKGITDKRTQRTLNNINVFLFTPALLFSKVAFFLSLEKLRELWVIPLFFLLVSGLSGLIANVFARICYLKRSQRNFAIAASMFMNSNSLPVALMQSLVATVPGLKWTPDDDQDAMFGRALTYLVVFSTLGMMLRWSYGVQLLSHADTEEPELIDQAASGRSGESGANKKIWIQSPTPEIGSRGSAQNTLQAQIYPRYRHREFAAHLPPAGFGEEISSSTPFHAPSDSDLETDSDETLVVHPLPAPSLLSNTTYTPSSHDYAIDAPSRSTTARERLPSYRTISLSQPLRTLIQRIRIPTPPPPLFASLLALLLTLPPFQPMLKSDLVAPVKGALDSAGACSVPLTLVVLGGWFWEDNGKEGKDAKRRHRSGADDGSMTESTRHETRIPGVPGRADDESELEQDGIERELRENHDSTHTQTRRRQVLACGSAEPLAARDRMQEQARHGVSRRDSGNISRSPSLSSLFSVLQDIWKMTPVSGRRRRRGPIHLADDYDEQDRDVDIEAGERAIWRMRSSTSPNGKQTSGHTDAIVDNDPTKAVRPTPPPGETTTVVVTLLSRMILTPLLILPLMAFLKIRGDGEGGIKVFDDPVFIVATILLVASPPALTLAQISQRAAAEPKPTPELEVTAATTASTSAGPTPVPSDTSTAASAPAPVSPPTSPTLTGASSSEANSPFERLISRTVFWAYCVVTPPVTIACVLIGMVFMSL